MSRWWPPAAATISASTASRWPTTSASSGGRFDATGIAVRGTGSRSNSGDFDSVQTARHRRGDGRPAPRHRRSAALRRRWRAGTTTRRIPARAAANTAGSIPGTGRNRPSSPSSPRCTVAPSDAASNPPAVARAATAIATSNPEPCLGRLAGDRLTVSRRRGRGSPQFCRGVVHPLHGLTERLVGQPDDRNSGI